jgi:cytochrome c-type biogenesis protein CcmH
VNVVRLRLILILVASLSLSAAAFAVQPDEVLNDPGLEARARSLSQTLRCMVCQNQSIDDSDAPLARDLRLLVRERLKAGDSDAQVRDFLVARYGEFVLLEPQRDRRTLLLWSMPVLVLLLGGLVLLGFFRRPQAAPKALNAEEKRRLKALSGKSADLTK